MTTIDDLRAEKREYQKDPVQYASGRVSHAVRHNLPAEEVLLRRRQLAGVQIEKYLDKMLHAMPPTTAKAKLLCEQIMAAAKEFDQQSSVA